MKRTTCKDMRDIESGLAAIKEGLKRARSAKLCGFIQLGTLNSKLGTESDARSAELRRFSEPETKN
jgi:hypothetical protein